VQVENSIFTFAIALFVLMLLHFSHMDSLCSCISCICFLLAMTGLSHSTINLALFSTIKLNSALAFLAFTTRTRNGADLLLLTVLYFALIYDRPTCFIILMYVLVVSVFCSLSAMTAFACHSASRVARTFDSCYAYQQMIEVSS